MGRGKGVVADVGSFGVQGLFTTQNNLKHLSGTLKDPLGSRVIPSNGHPGLQMVGVGSVNEKCCCMILM